MESWRLVWREGFAPVLSPEALQALAAGLRSDDPALHQGATTTPPPLICVQDWPCEGGDALAYAGWKGLGLQAVGEVQEFFARVCFEADQRLGEPAACRWFLNFFDDAPRGECFTLLLAEVEYELGKRGLIVPPPSDPTLPRQNCVGESGGLQRGNEAKVVLG